MDIVLFKNEKSEDYKIEEIINRAVILFKKTGLRELAEKWDKILRTIVTRKEFA